MKKQKRDKKREGENKTKMGRGQVNECSKRKKNRKMHMKVTTGVYAAFLFFSEFC